MYHRRSRAMVRRPRATAPVEETSEEIETLIEGHENLTRRLYLELRQERARHDALQQHYMDLENYCYATEGYLRNERAERQEIEMQMRDLEKITEAGRKFVVVLIDADGYKFHEHYLLKADERGGVVADELLAAVRGYMSTFLPDPENIDVVVRAYANLRDLGRACWREMRTFTDDLRQFAGDFNAQQPLFDIIDVGRGKERADRKIQELMTFYMDNKQQEKP